jgi:type II secretory pathway predicted ATPase ExeA
LFSAQQKALAEIIRSMDADARWVLLVGEKHSGKSTVVRALLAELRLTLATVAVLEGQQVTRIEEVIDGVREQLGLPRKRRFFGTDRSGSDILAHQSTVGTPLVVVVDDADTLSMASLKWLIHLTARSARAQNACYVVVAGTPALEKALGRAGISGRSDRAVQITVLGAMTSGEVRRSIDLSAADTSVKFSEGAIEKIEVYSGGRPGLVTQLCARAVALPSTRMTNHVSPDAVVEAADSLGLSQVSRFPAKDASQTDSVSPQRVVRRAAVTFATTLLATLVLYVGVRVGLRLMETPPIERAISATKQTGGDSDPGTVSAPAAVVSSTPRTPRAGEPRSPERPERAVITQPSAKSQPSAQPQSSAPSKPSAQPQPSARSQASAQPPPSAQSQVSAQQIAALMARAREGEVRELTRLISGGVSPNARDVGGFTALMAAIVNDQMGAARALLDRGADVNVRAHGGITALMLAVINDRPDAVKLLLERGADINAQSGAGWTALTFAVWKHDAKLERVLLSHGARPNLIDKQGWRPVEYAASPLTPPAGSPSGTEPAMTAEPVPVKGSQAR